MVRLRAWMFVLAGCLALPPVSPFPSGAPNSGDESASYSDPIGVLGHTLRVSISAIPDSGAALPHLAFQAIVTGETLYSYVWTFGDGERSHDQDLYWDLPVAMATTHVFALPGTYLVTLLVTDTDGDQSGASIVVAVGGLIVIGAFVALVLVAVLRRWRPPPQQLRLPVEQPIPPDS